MKTRFFLNFGDMFDGKLWLFYNVQFSFLDFLAFLTEIGFSFGGTQFNSKGCIGMKV